MLISALSPVKMHTGQAPKTIDHAPGEEDEEIRASVDDNFAVAPANHTESKKLVR